MKIIIAPDSFKASMTATEAATAIECGIKKIIGDADIIKIPMADGGEGTVSALVASTKGRFAETTAYDPLGNKRTGIYGILGDEKTAVIEMAAISGLPLVPQDLQNPLHTTTYGTGEMIRDALDAGCREFIIGIGGSATNDAGTGMAQALGVIFFQEDGSEITDLMCGGLLRDVASIDLSGLHPAIIESHITVACDVDNPLLGPRGCAYVYAPQKGATPEIVDKLDNDMAHFINIAEKATGNSVRDVPGAGAAGGLGAGLMAFLNAELKPGIELVLNASDFPNRISGADMIITGEGKLDYQTVFGKTIAGITSAARQKNIPVIALAGTIEPSLKLYEIGLLSYFSICPGPINLADAIQRGPDLLEDLAERVMRLYIKQESDIGNRIQTNKFY